MTMANITINDGNTTPVAHVFVPQNAQLSPTGMSRHVEKLAGRSAKAWPQLEYQANLSSDVKKDHVSRLKLTMPVVSVVDGLEVLQGSHTGFITVVTPYGLNSTDALKVFFGLLKNALMHAESTGVFVDQTPRQ